jgi:hypothetical protein
MERITIGRMTLDISHHADTCTHCNHSMMPEMIATNLVGQPEKKGTNLEIVYRCTRNVCSRLFISAYRRLTSQDKNMIRDFRFISSMPISANKPEVPDEVERVSPSFYEVYLQAHFS